MIAFSANLREWRGMGRGGHAESRFRLFLSLHSHGVIVPVLWNIPVRRVGSVAAGLCFACVGLLLTVPAGLAAQKVEASQQTGSEKRAEPLRERSERPTEENDAVKPDLAREQAKRARRQRVVTAAVLLLAGIAAVGLVLVGLIVLWGARMRRIARSGLPRQSPVDDLWYLRPKKELPPSKPADQEEADSNQREHE